MKAIVIDEYGGPEVLRPGDLATPEPGVGQLLIRVMATSVNRPDIIQRQGNYPAPAGESSVPGLECAGTVAGLGPAVSGFAVGDGVFALLGGGGYAQYAVAKAAHTLPIPAGMQFDSAACIAETYITAWLNLFENADLTDGKSVLLHGGGGGVNTAAIQLVKTLCPASSVLVTASPRKLDRVGALGADLVIDYLARDFAEATLEFTQGTGVDVILDHIGAGYLDRNLKALAIGGRLVVIGITQGSEARISLGRLMVKRQRIIGSVLRPRPDDEKAAIIDRFSEKVVPLIASGRIDPVIDSRFALADAAAAHRRMEASEHFGKIVLKPEPDDH